MTTAPLPRLAEYTLSHVWSTGTDADTSVYDEVHYQTPPGVRIDGIGRSQIRAFGPPGTPSLDDVIPNTDGVYSPGGILGLFVRRGPETTFDADWGTDVLVDADDVTVDATGMLVDGRFTEPLFTGNISTAPQDIRRATANVQIRSLGTIRKLALVKPITTLYENIRTDQAITVLLDAAGWDPALRSIDTGDTTLLYWWLDGSTDAFSALEAILAAEGVPSCAYQAEDGTFHFEGRQYRLNAARSTDVQWNFFDGPRGSGNPPVDDEFTLVDDPGVLVDGPLANPLFHVVPAQWTGNPDEVVSSAATSVNVRTPTATMKIWEFGGTLVLTAGEVRDLEVTDDAPFKSAVTPVAATDYTVTVGSLASVALLSTSGQKVTLRLTAGGSGATVLGVTSNGIQVRAVSVPVTQTIPVKSTVDTSLASARYEPKDDYALQSSPEIAFNIALQNANNFVRRYQRPRDQMVIQVANIDANHMYAMLRSRVSDRVRIVHTHGGINASFYIETRHHDLSAGGGLHILTLGCERVTDDVPSVFGTARFGFAVFSE